jgi:hypothetical protein
VRHCRRCPIDLAFDGCDGRRHEIQLIVDYGRKQKRKLADVSTESFKNRMMHLLLLYFLGLTFKINLSEHFPTREPWLALVPLLVQMTTRTVKFTQIQMSHIWDLMMRSDLTLTVSIPVFPGSRPETQQLSFNLTWHKNL